MNKPLTNKDKIFVWKNSLSLNLSSHNLIFIIKATSPLMIFINLHGTLLSYYSDSSANITKEYCTEIIRFYDTTRSQVLYYTDFLLMVLPREELKSNLLEREVSKEDYSLPYQVKSKLLKILESECELVKDLEVIYKDLRTKPKFRVFHFFHFMDPEDDFYLSISHMHEFLRGENCRLDVPEIKAILWRLDADKDGRVSYLDFKHILRGDNEDLLVSSPIRGVSSIYKTKYFSPQAKRERRVMEEYTPARRSKVILKEPINEDRTESIIKPITTENEETSKGELLVKENGHYDVKDELGASVLEETQVVSPGITEVTAAQSPYKEIFKELNSDWDIDLVKLFTRQIALDKELEEAKMELYSKADFTLAKAFNYFDQKRRGSITTYELKGGLKELKANYNTEHILLLMKRYDLDSNGSLDFSEFTKMLSPIVPNNTNKVLTTYNTFNKGTTKLLKETFELLVKTEKMAENIRKKAKTEILIDAFIRCDKENKGFLIKEDIQEILQRNKLPTEDAELLMNRYDKDLNGKITMQEVYLVHKTSL